MCIFRMLRPCIAASVSVVSERDGIAAAVLEVGELRQLSDPRELDCSGGTVTLLASGMRGLFTDAALAGLSLTGNVIISLVGVNLLFGKTIRTANLLPGILLSVLFTFLLGPGV